MKRILLLTLSVLLITVNSFAKDFTPKKFKTEFTITYNEMTLEEAARMEDTIKKKFEDACKINVDLDDAECTDCVTWTLIAE